MAAAAGAGAPPAPVQAAPEAAAAVFDEPGTPARASLDTCRRVLATLATVSGRSGDKGSRLAHFAPEFGAFLDDPRPLDLRGIAARLDKGVYHAAGACGRAPRAPGGQCGE